MIVTVSCHLQVSPQVGRFFTCFWPQSSGFDPTAVHVIFAVTKRHWGQFFSYYPYNYHLTTIIIPPKLQVHPKSVVGKIDPLKAALQRLSVTPLNNKWELKILQSSGYRMYHPAIWPQFVNVLYILLTISNGRFPIYHSPIVFFYNLSAQCSLRGRLISVQNELNIFTESLVTIRKTLFWQILNFIKGVLDGCVEAGAEYGSVDIIHDLLTRPG